MVRPPRVGHEFHTVAVGKAHPGKLLQRHIFVERLACPDAGNAHMRRAGKRTAVTYELRASSRAAEFVSGFLPKHAVSCHAHAPFAHQNDVAVLQTHVGHIAVEGKVIKIEAGNDLVAALHLHLAEGPAIRRNASGTVEIGHHGIHGTTGIAAGLVHKTRHIHGHRLRTLKIHVDVHVVRKHRGKPGFHRSLKRTRYLRVATCTGPTSGKKILPC